MNRYEIATGWGGDGILIVWGILAKSREEARERVRGLMTAKDVQILGVITPGLPVQEDWQERARLRAELGKGRN